MTPEEYLTMKPTVSGLAYWPAMIRSPSFSRSSSSVTTMIFPILIASMAATTEARPNCGGSLVAACGRKGGVRCGHRCYI